MTRRTIRPRPTARRPVEAGGRTLYLNLDAGRYARLRRLADRQDISVGTLIERILAARIAEDCETADAK